MAKKTFLIKINRGKLPNKKIVKEFARLRRMGFSIKLSDTFSRVRRKR